MNVQRTAIVENEKLVLRSLLDRDDAVAAESRQRARGDTSTERWMEEPDACDGVIYHRAANAPRCTLDFRQFRHRPSEHGILAGN